MSEEKRKHARRASGRPAWIVIEGSAIRHGCTVSDFSAAGACLAFPRPRRLPDRFYLMVGEGKTQRLCRPVWHQGRQVGITFHCAD